MPLITEKRLKANAEILIRQKIKRYLNIDRDESKSISMAESLVHYYYTQGEGGTEEHTEALALEEWALRVKWNIC